MSRLHAEVGRATVSVPWGRDWATEHTVFRIEDVHVDGRYRHTEAYAIHLGGCCRIHASREETHNPMGHFTRTSRKEARDELLRMVRKAYPCEDRCPHTSCVLYREFAASGFPIPDDET